MLPTCKAYRFSKGFQYTGSLASDSFARRNRNICRETDYSNRKLRAHYSHWGANWLYDGTLYRIAV